MGTLRLMDGALPVCQVPYCTQVHQPRSLPLRKCDGREGGVHKMTVHSHPHSAREGSKGTCAGLEVKMEPPGHPGVREGFLEEVTFSLDTER